MTFQEFLKATIIIKKGFITRDPRGANVVRCGHVAVPHELTQTHAGTHVARWINMAKYVGLMGIMDPIVRIRGAH